MLKVKKVDGKFDIIFDHNAIAAPDLLRKGLNKSTSAGRRKEEERKSHVFEKKKPVGPTRMKDNKASKLRSSGESSPREKPESAATAIKPLSSIHENLVSDSHGSTSNAREESGKQSAKRVVNDQLQDHIDNMKDTYMKLPDSQTSAEIHEWPVSKPSKSHEAKISFHPETYGGLGHSSEKPGFQRKDTYVKPASIAYPLDTDLMMQATGLDKFLRDFVGDESQGTTPTHRRQPSIGRANEALREDSLMAAKDFSSDKTLNVWEHGRSSGYQPNWKSDIEQQIREKEERKRAEQTMRASPVEDYNPWGKPGCGAPMKDQTGRVITDYGKRSLLNRNATDSQQRQAPKSLPTQKGDDSVEKWLSKNQQVEASPQGFARGQNIAKSRFELDELEQRRLKHLEHQKAIEEQVEQKRRLKQLEREKEREDEMAAEARWNREQEILRKRAEEEDARKREAEEARARQQDYLRESMLQAQEAAMQAKQEHRNARQLTGSESRQPEKIKASSKPYTEDDIFKQSGVPKASNLHLLASSGYEQARPFNHEHRRRVQPPSGGRIEEISSPVIEEALHVTGSGATGMPRDRQATASEVQSAFSQGNEAVEMERVHGNQVRTSRIPRPAPALVERSLEEDLRTQNDRFKTAVVSSTKGISTLPHASEPRPIMHDPADSTNDHDIRRDSSFRSSTINQEHVLRQSTTDQVNAGHPELSERNSRPNRDIESSTSLRTEHLSSAGSTPSNRQLQILDQLHALRRGLLKKQQEYAH